MLEEIGYPSIRHIVSPAHLIIVRVVSLEPPTYSCGVQPASRSVAPLWTLVACRAKKSSRADARRRRRPTLFLSHTLRLLWACGDRVCGVSRVCGFVFWGTFNQHVFSLGGGFAACWNPSILLAGLAAGCFVPWKAYARLCLLLESLRCCPLSLRHHRTVCLESCMHARTYTHTAGISSTLPVRACVVLLKHRGAYETQPTLYHAACHVRDEDTTHKSQQGTFRWNSWRKAKFCLQ
jgi:hypothetical protein